MANISIRSEVLAMSKKLLTSEVAEALRVSKDTVRNWVHEGRLRAARMTPRGPMLFDQQDVQDALQPVGRPGTQPAAQTA
jgi:excisionase family DNA binding protein